jgi:hypothetical protein
MRGGPSTKAERLALGAPHLLLGLWAIPAHADHGTPVAWWLNDRGQSNVPDPSTEFVAVAGFWAHSLGLKAGGPAKGGEK